MTDYIQLIGSPKQIAWAEDIRAGAIDCARAQIADMRARAEWSPNGAAMLAVIEIAEAAIEDALKQTDAAIWISVRAGEGARLPLAAWLVNEGAWQKRRPTDRRYQLESYFPYFGTKRPEPES